MNKHYRTVQSNVWLPYHFSVGPVFNRFFEGLKEEKIWGNKCPQCGKILVPARTFCPECNVDMGEWIEVSQEGEVVTWTVAAEPFYGAPAETPLIGSLIKLDGTDCGFLHLLGGVGASEPSDVNKAVRKGARVKAAWRDEKQGCMMDIRHFALI